MRIFIAAPYSQLCNRKYVLKKKYKVFFIKLINSLEKNGHECFLAHRREKWGKEYTSDLESTKIDFEEIRKTDLLCIIPGMPVSGGVHIEIGWASSFNKKMFIFLKKNKHYSPMLTGINSITDAEFRFYKSEFDENLINMINECVQEYEKVIKK